MNVYDQRNGSVLKLTPMLGDSGWVVWPSLLQNAQAAMGAC